MRHTILITIMMISGSISAQVSTIKPTCSQIWLTTYSTPNKTSGKLINVDQDNLSIMLPQSASHPEKEIRSIHFSDIQQLSLRDTKQVGRSALYGALTGAVVGMIGGLLFYSSFDVDVPGIGSTKKSSPIGPVLSSGAIGAFTGSIIGTAIGSVKWTVSMNGDKAKLDQHRKKLESSICIK